VSAPKRRPSDDVGPNAGVPHGAAAVWLPLDALTPHPKNPRVHGPEVTRLARTILRTAWGAPIVAQWRASGRHRVIAGHGRLLAAREILAGVEVDGELRGGAEHLFDASAPGPGLLPVRIVRVSDAEADAMTLADNARAIQGEDSAELVAEMAAQFGRDAAVMADIGFDGAALDALIKGAGDAILGASGIAGAEMRDPADAFGALPDGDKQPFQQMTFTLHDSQAEVVRRALDAAKDAGDFDGSPNENSNGNALARIAEAFLG
jgi:hypothetical protein